MFKLRYSAVVVCLLSAVSCRGVCLTRAVPAAEDSVVDPQFIGAWKLTKKNSEAESKFKGMPSFIVIGRSEKSKTTMKYLFLDFPKIDQRKKQNKQEENNKKETLRYYHGLLHIHQGKKINTLCTDTPYGDSEVDRQIHIFFMYRYEFRDSNTLLLYKLDVDHFKKAVESKKLKGKVEQIPQSDVTTLTMTETGSKQKSATKTKIPEQKVTEKKRKETAVSLDDDPTKIIRYLEAHPEAFEKKPLVYKRINDKFTGG